MVAKFRARITHGKPRKPLSTAVNVASPSANWFCGYYDHSPFNSKDESIILVQSTRHSAWKKPSPRLPVSILVYDWVNRKVLAHLGQTLSWNWQQGARPLWFDFDRVIFNIYDERHDAYRAKIICMNTGSSDELPIPIQEIDSKGRVYGLSYEALAAIRPDYGYRNRSSMIRPLLDNGVDQFDFKTGKIKRLVSISTLLDEAAVRHQTRPVKFKLNHIMASPDSRFLVFLFRYFIGQKRVTDLYYFNLVSDELCLLVANSGVSHSCWWDAETLITTMNGHHGFGYYRLSVDGKSEPHLICNARDGHPSKLGNYHLLTDSYPDRYGLRHLMKLNVNDGTFREICASPEPMLFQGETRCDLHPSLSPSGRWIQFDCAVGHRRSVAVIKNPVHKDA